MDQNYTKKRIIKSDTTCKDNPNNFQIMVKKGSQDLYPLNVGKATIAAGRQEIARCSANSVLLFFSCKGGGSFKLRDTWYHVKEHDFFVLPTGSNTLLYSDTKTGWTHRWICFSGSLIHDFMNFPPVFSLPEEFVATLYDPTEIERNLFSRLAGDLYHIHAKMHTPEEDEPDYIQRVINHINASYKEKLTVTQMAKELGVDRSHLSRLFRSRMGITIQDYIIHLRITKAKQHLLNGYSVSDTAALCGFGDYINFSRVFLREAGIRPTEWVKYINDSESNKPR